GKFSDLHAERREKDSESDRCGDRNGIGGASGEFSASVRLSLQLGEKMMARKTIIWTAVLSLFLVVSGCAVQQAKFGSSNASRLSALAGGEIKDALAFYEGQAQEAEKSAANGGLSSQYYWGVSINAYVQAADAARDTGQLQKAITFGEKALDIAHTTNVSAPGRGTIQGNWVSQPLPELLAINLLIRSYQIVGDYDKARALIERGLRLLKENPAGLLRV